MKRELDRGHRDVARPSGITHLDTGKGWAEPCAIQDGHGRRMEGRTVAKHVQAELVEDALRQAAALRGELAGKATFRAERGCQFTSQHLSNLAGELDLLRPMGRTAVCWDNAVE